MIQSAHTHVYLAGLTVAAKKFETVMVGRAGSMDEWQALKTDLIAEERFLEVLYD